MQKLPFLAFPQKKCLTFPRDPSLGISCFETEWQQIFAVCLFLATAALLMVVRVWLPPTFEGVDPEAQVSARIRLQKPSSTPLD